MTDSRIHRASIDFLLALAATLLYTGCSQTSTGQEPPRSSDGGGQPRGDTTTPRAPGPDADVEVRSPRADAASEPDAGRVEGGPDGALAPTSTPSVPGLVLESWRMPDGRVRRGDAWRLYLKGLEATRRDELDRAGELLSKSIAVDPTYELAQAALGVVYMRAKRYDDCVAVSQRCVQTIFDSSTMGACYYNLGKCLEHLGEDESAYDAYLASLEVRANDTVERALKAESRKLRRTGKIVIDRVRREETEQSAALFFLRQTCKAKVIRDEPPGTSRCGPLTVWGTSGSFSSPGADEVLLAVRDDRVVHAKGLGYGVLLRRSERQWKQLAQTRLLSPGEGGVDFEGSLEGRGGVSVPVVQVSDCWLGCCQGSVIAIKTKMTGDEIELTASKLLDVGSTTGSGEGESKQALVTGSRSIDEGGDGSPELLLRYEQRVGKANPSVTYLRVRLDGAEPTLVGKVSNRSFLPRCR